jgi:hypothetical protein
MGFKALAVPFSNYPVQTESSMPDRTPRSGCGVGSYGRDRSQTPQPASIVIGLGITRSTGPQQISGFVAISSR